MKKLFALSFVALLSIGLLIAACGDDDGEAEPTADAGAHMGDDAGEGTHVSLTEWAITGENGAPFEAHSAGEINFEVHNDGSAVHELAIVKTGLAAGALPMDGSKVDEEKAGELIGRVKQFQAGEVKSGRFEMTSGKYAFICNIPGHYQRGMYAGFEVTE